MDHDWQQILSEHGPTVWRTVRCLLGNEADARDCYQTVFLEGYQFSQTKKVKNWSKLLKRIARMRALDYLRKKYRQAAHVDSEAVAEEGVSRIPSPEQALETAELAERLRSCLAQISPQQATAFVMRHIDQLSYDQIAQQTDSNRNAVGALLNRAKNQLRNLLEAEIDPTLNTQEESP